MRPTQILLIVVLLCLAVPSAFARAEAAPDREPGISTDLAGAWETASEWLTTAWRAVASVIDSGEDETSTAAPGEEDPDLPAIGPGIVPIG
ncbi:MAG: hypothetical protein MI919_25660 [Holophagales bacterium]|nr:hypothetical protein [Holophagales bacterium]